MGAPGAFSAPTLLPAGALRSGIGERDALQCQG